MGTATIAAVTALVTLYVTIPIRAQGDLPGPHPDLPWRPGRNNPIEEEDYVELDDDSGDGNDVDDPPDSSGDGNDADDSPDSSGDGDDVDGSPDSSGDGNDGDDSPDGGGDGNDVYDSPDGGGGGGGIVTDYDTTWWRPVFPLPPPRPRPCWTPLPCRFGFNCGRVPHVVRPRVVYTEVSPLPPYDDPADDEEGPVTPTPQRPHPATMRTTTASLSATPIAAGPLRVVDDHFAETDKSAPRVRVMVDYFTPTPANSLMAPVPTTTAAAPSSTELERTTAPTTAPSTRGGDEQRMRDDETTSDKVATTLLRSSQLVTTLRPPTTLGAVRFFVADGGDPTHQGFAALVAVMGAASYAIARLFT